MSAIYCVSVHLVDRAYGGPEEGGWWFTYGHPPGHHDIRWHRFTRFFREHQKAEAMAYQGRLNRALQVINHGLPSIGSMSSQGQYRAIRQEGEPHVWPESKPHYE